MAELSAISWTKSTFNPWVGCTKVGPGCDHCYAEALDKRHRWAGDTHWGDDKPRYRTSVHNWNNPGRWDKKQAALLKAWEWGVAAYGGNEQECIKAGHIKPEPWRVFCASLADVFDNQVQQQWRDDLWRVIEATPNLSWLLVTKRISNVRNMVPNEWLYDRFPPNVRLLITVVNQAEANRDVPKLLALRCRNGISYEPALGPIDWCELLGMWWNSTAQCFEGFGKRINPNNLEWIIVGGESGGQARPFELDWAASTIRQCKAAGVPVFVKQLGSHPITDVRTLPGWGGQLSSAFRIKFNDRAGADPAEWPESLRVQEFPA